jgi:hypothetical protein
MIRIKSDTTKLWPQVRGPSCAVNVSGGSVNFTTREIRATGSVDLTGNPGDACGGWKFGFVQLQLVETNRARYRGVTPHDGSVLLTLDRPPARLTKLCRDTLSPALPGVFFYNEPPGHPSLTVTNLPAGTVIPSSGQLTIAATFVDRPDQQYPVKQRNTAVSPSRDNFIHSVEIGFAFCTILTAREPGSGLIPHFLKHFYWNCRWYVHFSPTAGGSVVLHPPVDMALNLQHTVHRGIPNDPRFSEIHLKNLALPICQTVVDSAEARPNLHHSTSWELG